MAVTVQKKTKVLPGHRIEIEDPELPEGSPATVFIILEEESPPKRGIFDILKEYPGERSFKTAEEVDAYLKAERESWDK